MKTMSVIATDAIVSKNGCKDSTDVTKVIVPPPTSHPAIVTVGDLCSGYVTLSITNATEITSVKWYKAGMVAPLPDDGPSIHITSAGDYYAEVFRNACGYQTAPIRVEMAVDFFSSRTS